MRGFSPCPLLVRRRAGCRVRPTVRAVLTFLYVSFQYKKRQPRSARPGTDTVLVYGAARGASKCRSIASYKPTPPRVDINTKYHDIGSCINMRLHCGPVIYRRFRGSLARKSCRAVSIAASWCNDLRSTFGLPTLPSGFVYVMYIIVGCRGYCTEIEAPYCVCSPKPGSTYLTCRALYVYLSLVPRIVHGGGASRS